MVGNNTETRVTNKGKILLVDDDPAFLKVAQAVLLAKGFDVDIALTGKEALELVGERFFNLVILDIFLPDMSGMDLLVAINRIQPDVVSIISTGYSSVENSVQSLNLGAFAYLEKPLNPDRVLDVINRGLEKQHLLLENRRLLRELEQRNRDLNILLSVSQTISCSMDSGRIIDSALDILAHSMGFEAIYLLFLNSSVPELKGIYGLDDLSRNQLTEIIFTGTVIEKVIKEREAAEFIDIKSSKDPLLRFCEHRGYIAFLAVPVSTSKEVEGVLVVAVKQAHVFRSLEISLLKATGREIAVALANSRLFEEASNVKALRELDTLRTELLANVSHELRTPLAAIKGFASSLLQPDITFDDETRKSFIQTIDSEADRLSHMIDDLLLMSRIEAGAFQANKEWYSIAEIINSIKDRLYNIAIKHNLRIDVQDELPDIYVDGHRIGEIVSNLVENAVKYSSEGSDIKISVHLQGSDMITHVADSGIGIPREYQPMIFDRFNRLSNRSGLRKGSGLGLCICRGIVESHGGKIWVDSEPGQGATFSFSVPLNQVDQPERPVDSR